MSKNTQHRNVRNKPTVQLKRKPKFGPVRPPKPKRTRRRTQRKAHGPSLPPGSHRHAGRSYSGYGDYTEDKGRALYEKKKAKKKGGGKKSGGGWWDVATGIGEKVLPMLGHAAFAALTGMGDYEVDTNTVAAAATGGRLGGDIPLMENSHSANIMHHKEYIGPINGSTTDFAVAAEYSLNPGLAATFPWLSPIANCYTRYRMRGAVFVYEPLASDYTTAGSLGFVALGSQYNPLDAPFTSKREMLNHEFSQECKPSKTMSHPIECAPKQMAIEEYYIRDSPPPSNADIRFYDLCKTTVAVGGNPVDTQIGDLWLTFEVEFFQPKIETGVAHTDVEVMEYDIAGPSYNHPFGTSHTQTGNMQSVLVYGDSGAAGGDYLQFSGCQNNIYLINFAFNDGTAVVINNGGNALITWALGEAEVVEVYMNSENGDTAQNWNWSCSYRILVPLCTLGFSCMAANGWVLPLAGAPRGMLMVTKINPIELPQKKKIKDLTKHHHKKHVDVKFQHSCEDLYPRINKTPDPFKVQKTGLNYAKEIQHPSNPFNPNNEYKAYLGHLKVTEDDSSEETDSEIDDIASVVIDTLVANGLVQTQEQRTKRDTEFMASMLSAMTSMFENSQKMISNANLISKSL